MDFQETFLFEAVLFLVQVSTIHSFLFLFEINEIGDEAEKMRRDNTKSRFLISSMDFSSSNYYLKPTYLFCKISVDVSNGLDIFVVMCLKNM